MLTGASVLILEIVGARLIAPYFGTSTYVWTAMIGVILGALSVGYWIGGKAADKDNPKDDLSLLLIVASVLIVLSSLFHKPVLELIAMGDFDLRISALLAAFVLFSIPSMLIGMISPHLAKIRVQSLKNSGETIGRLEAAGAIGSIMGVFLSGYFLLSYFGSRDISMFLAVVLLATSFIADTKRLIPLRIILVLTTFALLFSGSSSANTLLDKDSAYTRYQVIQEVRNGKTINLLKTDDKTIQSAFYPDYPEESAMSYSTKILSIIDELDVPKDNILMIGGGAYTLPTLLSQKYPDSHITVVEIDPALDDIAREFFGFKNTDKISVVYEDGRTFLNDNTNSYDIIIVDAYNSATIPFHLATVEATERLSSALKEEGVLVANIISRQPDGILSSINRTYQEFFQTKNYSTRDIYNIAQRNGYITVASRRFSAEQLINQQNMVTVQGEGIVLRDDFAPVDKISF